MFFFNPCHRNKKEKLEEPNVDATKNESYEFGETGQVVIVIGQLLCASGPWLATQYPQGKYDLILQRSSCNCGLNRAMMHTDSCQVFKETFQPTQLLGAQSWTIALQGVQVDCMRCKCCILLTYRALLSIILEHAPQSAKEPSGWQL